MIGAVMFVTVELCETGSRSPPPAPQCECAKQSPSGRSPTPPETLGLIRVELLPPHPCNALKQAQLTAACARHTHTHSQEHTRTH